MNQDISPTQPVPEDARWELPDYAHDRELGAGASGRVVLARHLATGTPVAIKYLTEAGAEPQFSPPMRRSASGCFINSNQKA